MAFPTIPTVAAGRVLSNVQADTTATRTFPSLSGLTKNSGDLLIAICVAYQTSTGTDAAFSGWTGSFTEFVDRATSTTMAIGAAYKWSTGSETGTIAVTQAGTITGHAAMFLLSIPGAHATTPPEGGPKANGTTAAADPAAFDPAAWANEDTLWISVGASGETGTGGAYDGITTPPTNYTSEVITGISADAVGGVEAGVAFRQLNASSEDVGVWGADLSNARNSALVIAVRPPVLPQTINGGTAAEADSAPAGTFDQSAPPIVYGRLVQLPRKRRRRRKPLALVRSGFVPSGAAQTISGGVASEADSVPAGKVLQTYVGGVAQEADSVPAGKVLQTYAGGVAQEADSAPVGKVLQTYVGEVAREADSVPAGAADAPQTVSGGVAAEADSVPAGSATQAAFVRKGRQIVVGARRVVRRVRRPRWYLPRVEEMPGPRTFSGGVAQEADSVVGGAVAQLGGVAREADSAVGGSVIQIGSAPVPKVFVSATRRRPPKPKPPPVFIWHGAFVQDFQTIPGGAARETDFASGGTIDQVGPRTFSATGSAAETDQAKGGTVVQVSPPAILGAFVSIARRRFRLRAKPRRPFVRRQKHVAAPQIVLGGVAVEQDSAQAGVASNVFTKAGAATSQAAALGADTFEGTETGKALAGTKTTGADTFEATESGTATAGTRAFGADVFTATEIGTATVGTFATAPNPAGITFVDYVGPLEMSLNEVVHSMTVTGITASMTVTSKTHSATLNSVEHDLDVEESERALTVDP